MSPLHSLFSGLRSLFRRPSVERELDDELQHYLEQARREWLARGKSPAEADRLARAELGSVESVKEEARSAGWEYQIDTLWRDLRYAARGLVRQPAFSAVAVLTLVIGIGANTAIFSAIDALLLRALPYPEPARLMDLALTSDEGQPSPWSWRKAGLFRETEKSFRSIALHSSQQVTLTGPDPERVTAEFVTSPYLATLGLRVTLGRDFPAAADSGPNARRVALVSRALWQRRFQDAPRVSGQILHVDSDAYEVIGVLPQGFEGLSGRAAVLLPIAARTAESLEGPWDLEFAMIGRLKPGVSPQDAEAETALLGPRIYDAFPMGQGSLTTAKTVKWSAVARPLDTIRVASRLRRSLLVLFGAVGLVLLIACVNLANLLLGRAAARRQEISIRLAIGAGRARLVRFLLAESLLIALVGGAASLVVGWWGTRVLSTINPQDALRAQNLAGGIGAAGFESIRLDLRALLFTFLITTVVGLLFGLLPALQATRPELTRGLRDDGALAPTRRGAGKRLGASRRALVAAEIALAMVLLAGSGLMLRSLRNLLDVDPGFEPSGLLTLQLNVPPGVTSPDSLPGFYQQLQDAVGALPGVRQVALADCPPLAGGCNGTIMTFPDRPQSATGNAMVGVHWVTPSWFGTLGVPLKRGRLLDPGDRLTTQKVVVINEEAARRYFPGEDPIGHTVKVYQGGFHTGALVVGIVGDVRFETIDSVARPDVYISYGQARMSRMMIFVKSAGDPAALAPSVRNALRRLAPLDPVYDVRSMVERVGSASAQARFSATVLALFAAVALGLAVVGIYGVLSFAVTQRTREIGIRQALGADRASVLGLIMREGIGLAATGVVIGLGGALLLTRLLRALLFEVRPSDPVTLAAMVLVIGVAALAASWLPARRAAGLDPLVALRQG